MRVVIELHPEEHEALMALAIGERRSLRDQAAVVIRQTLEHSGFLPVYEGSFAENQQLERAA